MKKSLAKKVTLSILAGAMLMTSSVAWAEASLGVNVGIDGNGDTVMTSFYIGPSNTDIVSAMYKNTITNSNTI